MRILVRVTPGVEPKLADWARHRMELTLNRFAGSVRSLTVRIGDINGPRGGVDQHCSVVVRLAASRRHIVIDEIAEESGMAVARAAERTARAVARALKSVNDRRIARPGYWRHI